MTEDILVVPSWWIDSNARLHQVARKNFIANANQETHFRILQIWQDFLKAVLSGNRTIEVNGLSIEEFLGVLDARLVLSGKVNSASRLFENIDPVCETGKSLSLTENGQRLFLGIQSAYSRSYDPQIVAPCFLNRHTIASLASVGSYSQCLYFLIGQRSQEHGTTSDMIPISELGVSNNDLSGLMNGLAPINQFEEFLPIQGENRVMIGLVDQPHICWRFRNNQSVTQARSIYLQDFYDRWVKSELSELKESLIAKIRNGDNRHSVHQILAKVRPGPCIWKSLVFDRELLLLDWIQRALTSQATLYPVGLDAADFLALLQGDLDRLDLINVRAFDDDRICVEGDDPSIFSTFPSTVEPCDVATVTKVEKGQRELNFEKDGGLEASEGKLRKVTGAVNGGMRQVALEELERLKRISPKNYTNLRRLFLDSLADGERETLADLQTKMQSSLFEEQLHKRMVKFMIENPGAWGYQPHPSQ